MQDDGSPRFFTPALHGPYHHVRYRPGPIRLHKHREMADLFFDADGQGISAAVLRRSVGISRIERAPEAVEPEVDLSGSWWFGGFVFKAFGHNISEGLSRLWAPNSMEADGAPETGRGQAPLKLVFVDVTGKGLSHEDQQRFKSTVQLFVKREAEILILGSTACSIERLFVPEAALEYPFSVSRMMHVTLGTYAANLARAAHGQPLDDAVSCSRLYLSRSKLGRHGSGSDFREISNEPELEQLFSDYGFKIIHPQDLSIAEQVRHYKHARVMAGANGSALHNCIFSLQCQKVIQLLTPPRVWGLRLQNTLCEFLGIEQINLAAEPTDKDNRHFHMDPSKVEARLSLLGAMA